MVALRPESQQGDHLEVRKEIRGLSLLFSHWSPPSSPHFLQIFNSKSNSRLQRTVNKHVQCNPEGCRLLLLNDSRESPCVHSELVVSNCTHHIHKFPESQFKFWWNKMMEQRPSHKTAWFQGILAVVSCFLWYKHRSRQPTCRQKILKEKNVFTKGEGFTKESSNYNEDYG